MTNNCLKSEKGVTLLTLTIYIIVLTAIVGIMAGVSSLFYNNIGMMKDATENAGDFDTLNSCLISDSKSNSVVVVDETAKTIKFEDGTEITPELLKDMGLVKKQLDGIKVLGNGELTKKLTVKTSMFSKTAKEKIEKNGGKAEVI